MNTEKSIVCTLTMITANLPDNLKSHNFLELIRADNSKTIGWANNEQEI